MSRCDPTRAYESGHATFMGIAVAVAPGALIPREETELLGCSALSILDAAGAASDSPTA